MRPRAPAVDGPDAGRRWPGWVAGLYLLLFGTLGLVLQLWWWQAAGQSWAARQWLAQPARLQDWSLTSLRSPWLGNHPRPATSHQLQARFAYTVDGRDFIGNQVFVVSLVDSTSDRDRERAIVLLREAQARDGAIDLWRDPAQPGRAVLVRELPAAFAAGVLAFMVFPCGPATATLLDRLVLGLARLGRRQRTDADADRLHRAVGRLWCLWHAGLALASLLLIAPWARSTLAGLLLGGLALALAWSPARAVWRALAAAAGSRSPPTSGGR